MELHNTMARTPRTHAPSKSSVTRQKKSAPDSSETQANTLINIEYAPQVEHHRQFLNKQDFDEEDYDLSEYPDKYWKKPNQALSDLIQLGVHATTSYIKIVRNDYDK